MVQDKSDKVERFSTLLVRYLDLRDDLLNAGDDLKFDRVKELRATAKNYLLRLDELIESYVSKT